GSHWQPAPDGVPLLRLIAILAAVLGLPFVLLSATGPLLQAWLARSASNAPYSLFALSNLAALLALIAYPALIEPRFSLHAQAIGWSWSFAGFAILSSIAAWMGQGSPEFEIPNSPRERLPLAIWFSLAAGGSMLLLSTTNQLGQNVAAVP